MESSNQSISSITTVKKAISENIFDESDVGIIEFLNEGLPFTGVIKHRYTDFIVNEIDLTNNIIWPPERKPKSLEDKQKVIEVKKVETIAEKETINLIEEVENKLNQLLNADDYANLLKFIEEINLSGSLKSQTLKIISPNDKNDRKAIHEIIRSLSSFLDSETIEENNTKYILIRVIGPGGKKRRFEHFNKYPSKYLEFTLYKTNIDSMGAICQIAKFLNRKPSNFGFAGNKDKRGITCQRVTLYHSTEEDFENAQNKKGWNPSIVIGDYKYSDHQLKMGDLSGNRFSLSLRFINVNDDSIIKKNIENLERNGFINYFGLQRFGSTNIKTHTVGREIIKKDWKIVVEMILKQNDMDPQINKAKLEFLKDYDWKKALKAIPFKCVEKNTNFLFVQFRYFDQKIDRCLIEGLKLHGINNFRNAFMMIPRNSRELYCHAYQSYLWNNAVSKRLKKYGSKPIIGDFVLKSKELEQEVDEDNPEQIVVEENKDDEEENNENSSQRKKKFIDFSELITTIDETNIAKYTLDDIIMPLYGSDLTLPENNPISEIIHEILKEDGITSEDFRNIKQEMFIRGGLRHMIARPKDLVWDFVRFNDKDQDILTPKYNIMKDPEGDNDGKYKALRIKFNLKKSVYATMLIRELTKSSTSFDFQSKLSEAIA